MTTKVPAAHIEFTSGASLEDALSSLSLASDYGAATGNSAAVNTTAINDAIAACADTGFVVVAPGISYNEVDLLLVDGVLIIVYSTNGTITYLSKDHGTTLPVTKGGLVLKGKGNTGILLRSLDYGVSAEPIAQILDASSGDIAAVELKNLLLDETTDLVAPSANKMKLYCRDDGGGNTQLTVRFPTGDPVVLSTQGRKSNITGSATWDPASIANGAQATTSVTVTGAVLGDFAIASASIDLGELILTAHVGAADTVHVCLNNATGGAVDLASFTVNVLVIRNY